MVQSANPEAMNEYLSGKCAHCWCERGAHRTNNYYGETGLFCNFRRHQQFEDSGLKLLHDRAPELLQRADDSIMVMKAAYNALNREQYSNTAEVLKSKIDALESIIGDILKKEQ